MKTSMQPDENSGPIFHFSTFASVVGACPQDDARVFRSNFLAWYDAFCIPGTLILVVHLSNLTWPSKSGSKDSMWIAPRIKKRKTIDWYNQPEALAQLTCCEELSPKQFDMFPPVFSCVNLIFPAWDSILSCSSFSLHQEVEFPAVA